MISLFRFKLWLNAVIRACRVLAKVGYLLKAGQIKVKPFADQSRSGQLASTLITEWSLFMLYN